MFLPQLVTLLCAEREAGKVQAGRAREEERGRERKREEERGRERDERTASDNVKRDVKRATQASAGPNSINSNHSVFLPKFNSSNPPPAPRNMLAMASTPEGKISLWLMSNDIKSS